MDAPEPTFDIRDIAWEDDKLSQCAATIDSQRWSGITGDSRFWEPVQAAIAAGQEVAPYTPPPEPSPEEQRAAAYAAEADPIKAKAEDYQTEADAWRLDGNDAMAAEAQAKADAYLREYLEKKLAIRQRFPDAADVNQFTAEAVADRFYLAGTGTYHRSTCSYVPDGGALSTVDAIREARPDAKACSRCNPPALP